MSSFMVVVSNCQVGFQGYSVVPAEMCFQFHLAKLIAEKRYPTLIIQNSFKQKLLS